MTCSTETTVGTLILILVLFFVVGVPLMTVFGGHGPIFPNFSVESTTVKAYNLTSDNRLFCIIIIGVKAHNPNQKKHSFDVSGIDMEVRKGKHHKLADDALPSFHLGPGDDTVVHLEAVGLHVGLKKKIAREVMADVAAGKGSVDLYMSGHVDSTSLRVTCKNVVVDFSRSTLIVKQKVDCGISVYASGE